MGTKALDSTPPPRVSMVLPVHNGARWLADAIASVLAQDFRDFELILVDDASRDASPAIMADAAAGDPRVTYLRLDKNVGLPAALNHGFSAARGEMHSWTSDDNLLRPQMLSRLVATLDAQPEADIVHADFALIAPAEREEATFDQEALDDLEASMAEATSPAGLEAAEAELADRTADLAQGPHCSAAHGR